MKKFITFFAAALMAVSATTLVSCGSDDDDADDAAELATPAHEADAMCLTISDSKSPYSMIEFTESGNYLVTSASESSSAKKNLFRAPAVTRSTSSGYYYGTYTKSGDTYTLKGFGTITVTAGSSSTVTVKISASGSSYEYKATKRDKLSSSSSRSKIYRTWALDSVYYDANIEGNTFEYACSVNEYAKYTQLEEEFLNKHNIYSSDANDNPIDPANYTSNIIITSTGSLIMVTAKQNVVWGLWKWANSTSNQILIWDDEEEEYDESDYLTVNMYISGNKFVFESIINRDLEDIYYKYKYVCHEVK